MHGHRLSLAIAVFAAMLFVFFAYMVNVDPRPLFDTQVREAVHSISTPPLTFVFGIFTQLGGAWFLVPLGLIVFLPLIRANRRKGALFAIQVLGANFMNELMKLYFHRPRPEPFFGYGVPIGYSFPSGHSFVSLCFYFALAGVWVNPQWTSARRALAWTAAALLPLAIGVSRVYIGVHYPTDVLAGWSAGIAWIAAVRAGALFRYPRHLPTATGCV